VLEYEVPRLEGLAGFNDAIVRIAGRVSVAEWRRRCEASLRASRTRRAATRSSSRLLLIGSLLALVGVPVAVTVISILLALR
jgi:hypothetical protein